MTLVKFQEFLPCSNEYKTQSAYIRHYCFYQDLLIVNRMFENNPFKQLIYALV